MCSGAVVKRADEAPPPSPPKQPEAPITTETQTTAQHRPANAGCIRQVSVLQRRRSTERELRCGDASMSEPPPSTSAPDRHDLLAVRTIDSRIGALASALELPSAAMIRRDRGDSEGMMGLRAAEEQLAVRAGVGARAAVEGVHIWPAIEDVVPIASEDVVGALAAVESVDPAPSVDVVHGQDQSSDEPTLNGVGCRNRDDVRAVLGLGRRLIHRYERTKITALRMSATHSRHSASRVDHRACLASNTLFPPVACETRRLRGEGRSRWLESGALEWLCGG